MARAAAGLTYDVEIRDPRGNVVAVDGGLDSLADELIRADAGGLIEDEHRHLGLVGEDGVIGIVGELVVIVGSQLVHQVELAGKRVGDSRLTIDESQGDALEGRLHAVVVLVGLDDDLLPLVPLQQAEGTGSHGILAI